MIVPGMFVCSSFLISVCMFIVSKALLISSATVIVRAGGAIWLNPFATVLLSVCVRRVLCCHAAFTCCVSVEISPLASCRDSHADCCFCSSVSVPPVPLQFVVRLLGR